MVQQTQEQWLGGKYVATSIDGGLAFPDFVAVAKAYGYPTITITQNAELPQKIAAALNTDGPVFCNVEIKPEHRVIPQVKFGRSLEDMDPALDRREFLQTMIVKPDPASLQ